MGSKHKYIVYTLLLLFFFQVGEKVIPHSHTEKENVIHIDFLNHENSEESEHKSEHDDGEELHSTFYQWASFEYSLDQYSLNIIAWFIARSIPTIEIESPLPYQLLPKVLATHLLEIHLYTSKAPPYLV